VPPSAAPESPQSNAYATVLQLDSAERHGSGAAYLEEWSADVVADRHAFVSHGLDLILLVFHEHMVAGSVEPPWLKAASEEQHQKTNDSSDNEPKDYRAEEGGQEAEDCRTNEPYPEVSQRAHRVVPTPEPKNAQAERLFLISSISLARRTSACSIPSNTMLRPVLPVSAEA
jgi:hypothetical protein